MGSLLAAFAFVASHLLTRRLTDPDSAFYLLDHPTERSLHARPTPRGGGMAIAATVLAAGAGVAAAYGGLPELGWLALGALLVVGVSFVDDRSHVHPGLRIVVHLAVAGVLVAGGFGLREIELPGAQWELPGLAGAAVAILYLVWMVNLYNFMDGMDGFAGGMAVIGFGAFALLSWRAGHLPLMALSGVTAAAAGGFLLLNFPPARIFMGDVGSSLLGFLAGALALWAARDDAFPLWISVLVFSPFIVDATVTLFLRLLRGDRIWEAHKRHFYQRLVQLGWSHRRTVLWEYALMIACSASAVSVIGLAPGAQRTLLLAWCVAYAMLMVAVYWMEALRRRRRERD